ncbi:serine/threonine-protein kinase [Nonomuraea sp. NPDC002799]
MPEQGDTLCGRYRLISELGRGGMGTVWLGHDEELSREVAVKLLNPGDVKQEPVARFKREARVMAMVKHPNIVVIHDVGEDQGTVFLVMERLLGVDLSKLLRERNPLPIPSIVEYGRQTAAALSCLHGAPATVVHRDLKPANLVLDQDGVLKLCDFGIASLPTMDMSRYTGTGAPIGTVAYMSPEQCRSHEVGPPSDVYSFGVVLYELLTGRLPYFVANSKAAAYMKQVLDTLPAPVEDHRADTPPELAELVHAMLAKGEDDRPDAAAVHAALSKMRGGTGRGETHEENDLLAELDKVRTRLQAGRQAEAGMRLVRLIDRAVTTLGPDHEVTRRIQAFGASSQTR